MGNLVDLAGSERAGRTQATGERLKEGANINMSLSTLARVISELAKGRGARAPFRDSKLTHFLKESLCGNSKTVMIAAISPNFLDYDETVSTLKFAQSVKLVQTSAVVNVVNDTKAIEKAMEAEMEALKAQLAAFQEQSEDVGAKEKLLQQLDDQKYLVELGKGFFGSDWNSLVNKEGTRRRALNTEQLRSLWSLPSPGDEWNPEAVQAKMSRVSTKDNKNRTGS